MRRPCNRAGKGKRGQKGMLARVLLAALVLQMLLPFPALAAEPKTIRVGYFAFPGYHEGLPIFRSACGGHLERFCPQIITIM